MPEQHVHPSDPGSPSAQALGAVRAAALTRLRLAVLAAGLAGQLAVAATGGTPLVVLPLTLVLLVLLDAVSAGAGPARAALLQRAATAGVLVVGVGAVVGLAGTSPADLRDVLGPALVVLQVLQVLTPRGRRELATGLLVALALLVLAASSSPDPVAGLALVAGWAACLAAVTLAVQARELERVDVALRPPARGPVVASVALGLALGLVAFLLVPTPPPSRAAAAGPSGGGSTGGSSDRARGLGAPGAVDLSARGTLSDRPLLAVPGDSPTLWRSAAYATWDGRTWTNGRPQTARLPGPPYLLGAVEGRPGTPRNDEVHLLDGSGQVWAPGTPVLLDGLPVLTTDRVAGLRTGAGAAEYEVTSVPPVDDPAVLRAAVGPGDPGPRWRQLPAGLPERVSALGRQLTAGAATRADAVRAVEDWLRASATYRLDSPVPRPGEDAVDRFLFVDRTGFCEQFAAAEVVLLRAGGIPARFVTGVAYGVPDGPDRLYRERDLHAWVEVSYEGLGWQPSDPTAGAQLASPGLRSRLAALLRGALRALERVPGGRVGAALLLLAVVAASTVVVRLLRRRRPAPATEPDPPAGPALAAFLRLDARLGAAHRQPAESLVELTARLRLHPEGARAVEVVQQECYAPAAPDPAQAVEVLDRLARS